jgi:hypothetical protein
MTLTDVISNRIVYGKRVIVNDNSSNNAVKISQSGTGNALFVEDQSSPDTTPTVIDSSGNLIIGNDTNLLGGNLELYRQDTGISLVIKKSTNSTSGPSVAFVKARGTNPSSDDIVTAGDFAGYISFQATNGLEENQCAAIAAVVEGTPSTTQMPGRIVFLTTPSGSNTLSERMRISNNGRVGINTTNPQRILHVNGIIRLEGLPTHANNAAAIAGGLAADDVYKTATGELRIVV